MTALTKLLDFADTLPNNKGIEFLQLLQGYQKEMIAEKTQLIEGYERIIKGTQDTPQSERIGQDMARLGTYEVVAVAGTADMLLSNPLNTVEGC
jgi:phage-related baseplate assembly protein